MTTTKKTKQLTIPDSLQSLKPVKILKGRAIFADNPFITPDNFYVETRNDLQLVGKGLEIKDKDSDEVAAGVIGSIKEVDTEEFLKLYTKNVGAIFDLSTTAQKALIAVFRAVQEQAKDKADIFLSYAEAERYYQELNYTAYPKRTSFITGITHLINANFLAPNAKGQNWYWINPNLLFNGNRVTFVKQYKIKRQEERVIKQESLI